MPSNRASTVSLTCYLDFNPSAVMFAPHHRDQIIISDVGIVLWLAAVITSIYYRGFAEVFRVYLVPYLW